MVPVAHRGLPFLSALYTLRYSYHQTHASISQFFSPPLRAALHGSHLLVSRNRTSLRRRALVQPLCFMPLSAMADSVYLSQGSLHRLNWMETSWLTLL